MMLVHSTNQSPFSNEMFYRRATADDCDMLFAWANDPLTRENSHNKAPIQYEAHVQWLQSKLDSPDCWIFLVIKDNMPVALLRLDKKENDVLLAYSVAPECRGKGIGTEAIAMLPAIIKNENIQCERIVADVYKSNIASIKIFLNAGYQRHENDEYYTFIKHIES